jgi:branched-chain amino acid transport system permease protein
VVAGLATGAIYALVLVGIILIFRVSKAVNFAQGQLGMIAAFLSWYLYDQVGLHPALGVLLGVATAVLVAVTFDVLVLQRASDRQVGVDLVATLGLMVLATAVAQLVLGNESHAFLDLGSSTVIPVDGVSLNLNDLITIVVALATLAVLEFVRRSTRLGSTIEAVAENRGVAEASGIAATRVRVAVWSVAAVVAAMAGLLVASRTSVDAFYMTPFAMKAFIAGILGGLDRFLLPMIAAFGLGIYESCVVYFIGTTAAAPAIFALIIVVLALAPRSFLREAGEARA